MIYNVSYRDKDGALAQKIIQASTRTECMTECRRIGITPVSIRTEDASRFKKNNPSSYSVSKKTVIGILAFIFLSLILFILSTIDKDPAPPTKISRKEKVSAPKVVRSTPHETIPSNIVDVAKTSPKVRHVKHPITGEDMVVTQKIVKLLPNASRIGTVFTNNVFRPPKKLYSTFSENYVASLMRVQLGMPVVGGRLPKNFDEEFKSRLNDPIEILPDDTEEDIRIKEQMIEVKKEMAKLISEGESPSEVILKERKELNRLAQMRRNYMKDLADYRRAGASKQEVADYVQAANKILDEYGVKHIKLPLEPITKIDDNKQE